MAFYRLSFAQNCDLDYPVTLPGWKCSACGGHGRGGNYCYASVDASKAKELGIFPPGIINYAEFCAMAVRLRPLFPNYAVISPITAFGKPTGRILTKHRDMLFSASSLLVTQSGYAQMMDQGASGLTATPITVGFGKQRDISLFDLEFPACLDEPPQFFEQKGCSVCGNRKRVSKEHAGIWRKSILEGCDVMGYKSGGVSFIIYSERFRELALKLHGGNGLRFSPVPVYS